MSQVTNLDAAVEYLESNGFKARRRTIAGVDVILIPHGTKLGSNSDIEIYARIMYIWPDPDHKDKWMVEFETLAPFPRFNSAENLKEACDMAMNLLTINTVLS